MRRLAADRKACASAALITLALASRSLADSITLRGSTIPMTGVTIESLRAGELVYRDARDKVQRRRLDEVQAVVFDDLPMLGAAEQAWQSGDADACLKQLLRAAARADDDNERLWLHARLARVHDFRKEYVQSAGHAAAAMLIDPSVYWRILTPLTEPAQMHEPGVAAAAEAYHMLTRADRAVRDLTLAQAIDDMIANVRPVHDRLTASYEGDALDPQATISGVSRDELLADEETASAPDPSTIPETSASDAGSSQTIPNAEANGAPDAPAPAPVSARDSAPPAPLAAPAAPAVDAPATHPSRTLTGEINDLGNEIEGPHSAAAIDSLLQAGGYVEARRICDEVAKKPGQRNLARFLHQYGLALRHTGRERDAAVMFTRCAIHYPETSYAVDSLIETGLIYRMAFNRLDTARRLLEQARDEARELGKEALAERAARLLASP